MPGADSILPDLSYLDDKADKIIGCICTHSHEDHIGALAHALKRFSFPVYGSPFTMGMVKSRTDEAGVTGRTKLNPVADGEKRSIGSFDCEFLPVTHSVPSGLITAIGTPQGMILHSSDFKLDLSPVDGRRTDLARIGAISNDPGIRLLLCDSTNADVPGRTASESEIGPVLAQMFRENEGRRVITASFASHIHRVQQIATAAVASGRYVATLGMSMKKNVALARELGLLRIPDVTPDRHRRRRVACHRARCVSCPPAPRPSLVRRSRSPPTATATGSRSPTPTPWCCRHIPFRATRPASGA